MRIMLKRFAEFGAEGTVSLITAARWRCFGMELAWRGNERNISRIPPGLYQLKTHNDGLTYALVGDGVVQYESQAEESDRWGIRFDRANLAAQLRGCIAVGQTFGFIGNDLAVQSSRPAHRQLMELLSWQSQNEILIQDRFGGWAHA